MARFWFTLMLASLLVLGGLPMGSALPAVEDDVYWFTIEDPGDDEAENCQRLNDMSSPTPCELVSFEIGNTDTHLLYRWGVATTDFGNSGQFGHVDYFVRMPGNIGPDFAHELTVRLTTDGLSVQEVLPAEWDGAVEVGLEGNYIIAAVPFAQLGGILDGGEVIAHQSWLNLSIVSNEFQVVTGGSDPGLGPRPGDSMDNVNSQSYVIQAYGALETPEIDPIIVEETVTGAVLDARESFSTGPPIMDDPCTPWNETCFMNAQPVSAHYIYKWALDLPSVELSFSQEIVNGSAELVVIDDFDSELVRIPSGDAVDAAVQEIISPVQTNVLTFVVELDRFEGSFEITAKEGPALDDGDMDDDMDHSDHDMDGGDDGNTTNDDGSDLEESGGIPGPGVVVLLAVLTGIISLRRRR